MDGALGRKRLARAAREDAVRVYRRLNALAHVRVAEPPRRRAKEDEGAACERAGLARVVAGDEVLVERVVAEGHDEHRVCVLEAVPERDPVLGGVEGGVVPPEVLLPVLGVGDDGGTDGDDAELGGGRAVEDGPEGADGGGRSDGGLGCRRRFG